MSIDNITRYEQYYNLSLVSYKFLFLSFLQISISKARSRVWYLKTGIRAVLANTALIPLLTLTLMFRKYGFISR